MNIKMKAYITFPIFVPAGAPSKSNYYRLPYVKQQNRIDSDYQTGNTTNDDTDTLEERNECTTTHC